MKPDCHETSINIALCYMKLQGKSMFVVLQNRIISWKRVLPQFMYCRRPKETHATMCNKQAFPWTLSVYWGLDVFGLGDTRDARQPNANSPNKSKKLKMGGRGTDSNGWIFFIEPIKLWKFPDQINIFPHLVHKKQVLKVGFFFCFVLFLASCNRNF